LGNLSNIKTYYYFITEFNSLQLIEISVYEIDFSQTHYVLKKNLRSIWGYFKFRFKNKFSQFFLSKQFFLIQRNLENGEHMSTCTVTWRKSNLIDD
jgi:hypothetical protein